MNCEHCGTETDDNDGILQHEIDSGEFHDSYHCRDALAAQLAAEREKSAGLAREAALPAGTRSVVYWNRLYLAAEAKLDALAQAGITIDEVQNFAAFTPEAKAAYPKPPKFLIRTKGEDLRQTSAEAKLSAALAAQKAAEERADELGYLLRRTSAAIVCLLNGSKVQFGTLLEDVEAALAPQAPAAEPEGSGK